MKTGPDLLSADRDKMPDRCSGTDYLGYGASLGLQPPRLAMPPYLLAHTNGPPSPLSTPKLACLATPLSDALGHYLLGADTPCLAPPPLSALSSHPSLALARITRLSPVPQGPWCHTP